MNYQLCEFRASYGTAAQLPAADRPEIAFAGRSNVGKSSLINRLCQRKSLARVSGKPAYFHKPFENLRLSDGKRSSYNRDL